MRPPFVPPGAGPRRDPDVRRCAGARPRSCPRWRQPHGRLEGLPRVPGRGQRACRDAAPPDVRLRHPVRSQGRRLARQGRQRPEDHRARAQPPRAARGSRRAIPVLRPVARVLDAALEELLRALPVTQGRLRVAEQGERRGAEPDFLAQYLEMRPCVGHGFSRCDRPSAQGAETAEVRQKVRLRPQDSTGRPSVCPHTAS